MLQISHLTFAYRGDNILGDIDIILPDTGVVALIGDNGTGKTTLLRLLAGELTPDSGSIRLDGEVAYLAQESEDMAHKSGGEKTRLALERIFARQHDVLLLDEPTNNLDFEAKGWLQNQILFARGLVIIVSHDRDFINQVADYVLEIKQQTLHLYAGNYDDYTARLEQEENQRRDEYEKAQKSIARLEARLKAARNTSTEMNHARYNKLRDENRMVFHGKKSKAQKTAGKIVRSIETEIMRFAQVEKPHERKTYQARLSPEFLRRRRLLKVDELTKAYGGKTLFADLNFELWTGERLCVTGKNGAGKTTLFKIILGELATDSGAIQLVPNLKLGYISQAVHGLNLAKTFLEQTDASPTESFQAATTMDLTVQDLKRPCGELSRGQLTKLAFLKCLLSPVDLLILDEPTNHLDIRARKNIEAALTDYAGAILYATHDEYLAGKIGGENLPLRQ